MTTVALQRTTLHTGQQMTNRDVHKSVEWVHWRLLDWAKWTGGRESLGQARNPIEKMMVQDLSRASQVIEVMTPEIEGTDKAVAQLRAQRKTRYRFVIFQYYLRQKTMTEIADRLRQSERHASMYLWAAQSAIGRFIMEKERAMEAGQ